MALVLLVAATIGSSATFVTTATASATPTPPSVIDLSNIPYDQSVAVQAFETNAVNEVLQTHNLPASDANAVLAWGRNDVRAQEYLDLVKIINEPAASRSTNDALVYAWFQQAYQNQQIAEAQDGINEYQRWSGLPIGDTKDLPQPKTAGGTGYCNFSPPGGSSGPFAGTYSGQSDPTCFAPCTSILGCTAPFPTVQQFEQWGTYDALQEQVNNPDYAEAATETAGAIAIGAAMNTLALTTPLAGTFGGAGISPSVASALFPFAARAFFTFGVRAGALTAEAFAEAASTAAEATAMTAGAILFVVGIAITFIVTTAFAIVELVQNAAIPVQLQAALTAAQNTSYDLHDVLGKSDGFATLFSLFLAQTMPDVNFDCTVFSADPCANAPDIPAVNAGTDPEWLVTFKGTDTTVASPTIYTVDQQSAAYITTRLSGSGWFVSTHWNAGDPNNAFAPTDGPGSSYPTLDFFYKNWDGTVMLAQRVENAGQPMFVTCPWDSTSPTTCNDKSTASSALTDTLEIVEPNGVKATAQMVPAASVLPNVLASVPSSATTGVSTEFSASATDPHNASATFTYDWQFVCPGAVVHVTEEPCHLDTANDSWTDLSGATVDFTFHIPGVYGVSVTATDSAGSTTRSFKVLSVGATQTTLTSTATSQVYGQDNTVTAVIAPLACTCVAPIGGDLWPSGTVQFYVDGVASGSPVQVSESPYNDNDGAATLDLTTLPVSASGHDVSATYLPGPPGPGISNGLAARSYFTGSSGDLGTPITVSQGYVTGTITPSWSTLPTPPVFGQAVTLTANLSGTTVNQPLGGLVLQFTSNGQPIGAPVTLDAHGFAQQTIYDLPVVSGCGGLGTICLGDQIGLTFVQPTGYQLEGIPQPGVFVKPGSTTTVLAPVTGAYGAETQLDVNVESNQPSDLSAVGDVEFTIAGTPVGPFPLDVNGNYSLSVVLPASGPGTNYPNGVPIEAQYVDGNYPTSSDTVMAAITPAPLTVTASDATVTYGDPAPSITAGYGGFVLNDSAVATPATCATAYAKGDGVGSYQSSCSGAADPNYAMSYVDGTVTVGPATLTASPESTAMTYGGTVPTYTVDYSGFVNGDGASVVTTAPTCTAIDQFDNPVTSSTPVGSYPIECAGGTATNYQFSFLDGTLTISPAPLVITAASPTITYGDPVPSIQPSSYATFENQDGAGSLSPGATCQTTYVQGDGVGTYPTSCLGAHDPNYAISYNGGLVTVLKAPLTVAPTPTTTTFGNPVPTIGFGYGGFVNGEGASAVATSPTCLAHDAHGNPVTSSTPAGTYTITCSGGAAANYRFVYQTAVLTVLPAPSTTTYTGGLTVWPGAAVPLSSLLATHAAACLPGVPIAYSLDANPLSGAPGAYAVGAAPTDTGGVSSTMLKTTSAWLPGLYTLTARAAGSTSCLGSQTSVVLLVQSRSQTVFGAGGYGVPGVGPVSFGMDLLPATRTTRAGGAVAVVEPGAWLLKGAVSSFSTLNRAGSASGTGSLYWWNAALSGGAGGWQLASATVAFTATFGSTLGTPPKLTSPGSFGLSLGYTPVPPQSTLPTSPPEALTGGSVFVP
jgi:hypothetical protein